MPTKLEQIEQIRLRAFAEIKAILGNPSAGSGCYVPDKYIQVDVRIHEQDRTSLLVREAQYLEWVFKSRQGTRWFDVPREIESELIGETTVFLER